MIKLKVRKIPAKPARMGRNPATGEEMMLPPKPASKKIRATPLKKLKDLVL
jgi:nucleoid DNA-binding protein